MTWRKLDPHMEYCNANHQLSFNRPRAKSEPALRLMSKFGIRTLNISCFRSDPAGVLVFLTGRFRQSSDGSYLTGRLLGTYRHSLCISVPPWHSPGG